MKQLPDGSISFYPSKYKYLFCLLGSIVFVAAGIFMLSDKEGYTFVAWICILFFSYGVISSARVLLLKPKPIVRITEKTLELDECAPLLWTDIKSFGERIKIVSVHKLGFFVFEVENLENYTLTGYQKANVAFGFNAFSVSIDIIQRSERKLLAQELYKRINK